MRTRVTGVGGRGAVAFVPLVARQPGNSRWNNTAGDPGWTALPCPGPAAVPRFGMIDATQASAVYAANTGGTWRPSIYTSLVNTATAGPNAIGVRRQSTNEMPVPAINPQRAPAIAFRRPIFLGQRQVVQPRVFPSYPAWGVAGGVPSA